MLAIVFSFPCTSWMRTVLGCTSPYDAFSFSWGSVEVVQAVAGLRDQGFHLQIYVLDWRTVAQMLLVWIYFFTPLGSSLCQSVWLSRAFPRWGLRSSCRRIDRILPHQKHILCTILFWTASPQQSSRQARQNSMLRAEGNELCRILVVFPRHASRLGYC